MEIARTSPVPNVAKPAQKAAPDAARGGAQSQVARARVQQAEAKREVGEAMAKAILADSNIEPADISKFSVSLDIHKETGRVIAEIRNKDTGEVLQKIPSDSILRGAVMLEQAIGTILDKPA